MPEFLSLDLLQGSGSKLRPAPSLGCSLGLHLESHAPCQLAPRMCCVVLRGPQNPPVTSHPGSHSLRFCCWTPRAMKGRTEALGTSLWLIPKGTRQGPKAAGMAAGRAVCHKSALSLHTPDTGMRSSPSSVHTSGRYDHTRCPGEVSQGPTDLSELPAGVPGRHSPWYPLAQAAGREELWRSPEPFVQSPRTLFF